MTCLRVYSRQGCHLCDVLLEELLPMVRDRLAVEVCNIDSQPEWRAKYHLRVPVVTYGNRVVCEHRVDREAIRGLLDSLPESRQHDAQ